MANVDHPNGLMLYGTGYCTWYDKDSTSSNILYVGDPVVRETDGNVVRATAGATNYVLGPVMALQDSSGRPVRTLGAAAEGKVLVCDDPNAQFIIQGDGSTGPCADGDEGANVDLVIGTGSTTEYQSAAEFAEDTAGTGNTLQLRIVKLWDGIYSGQVNAWGAHARVVVRINLHQHRYTTGV